jgi:hypothetical protein
MTSPAAQTADTAAVPHEVEIFVNKRPVDVPSRTTGSEIKDKAAVPADDQLFRVQGDKEIEVGNAEQIEVCLGERFVATPPIEPA